MLSCCSAVEEPGLLLLLTTVSVELLGCSDREMRWLVSTAWNRGCRNAKFLMHAQALPFMTAALDLMDTSDVYKENQEVSSSTPLYTVCMQYLSFNANASPLRSHVHGC